MYNYFQIKSYKLVFNSVIGKLLSMFGTLELVSIFSMVNFTKSKYRSNISGEIYPPD